MEKGQRLDARAARCLAWTGVSEEEAPAKSWLPWRRPKPLSGWRTFEGPATATAGVAVFLGERRAMRLRERWIVETDFFDAHT